MPKFLIGLICFSLVSDLAANTMRYPFSVTGEELIQQFYGPVATRGQPRSALSYQQYEIARGYISGVKDSTEGTAWCHVAKLKPDEVDSELISALMALPHSTLKGTAAPLLVAALKKRVPCSTRSVK